MEPGNLWSYYKDADTNPDKFEFPPLLPARPGFNAEPTARDVTVRVNQFRVTAWPDKPVWQFDVKIGNGDEPRGLLKIIWNSKTVQDALKKHAPYWLWDGNKIAWCDKPTPKMNAEKKIIVDLDALRNKTPRVINGQPQPDIKYVVLKCTTDVPMGAIRGYLFGNEKFDNSVLMAINFMDHCLRQFPSENFIQVKRSFFPRGTQRKVLGDQASVIEAQKGVYSSIRLCQAPPKSGSTAVQSTGLGVNVDVANGTFWIPQQLHQAARNMCGERNKELSWDNFAQTLRPVVAPGRKTSSGAQYHIMSRDFKELRKMNKLRFHVKHRGKEQNDRVYIIKNFVFHPDTYGSFGGHAKAVTFQKIDPKNKEAGAQNITIYDYFEKTYNVSLQHWKLPLVQTVKGGLFPMEVCTLVQDQRYMHKLDPIQTADMIKFAVVEPNLRLGSIKAGVDLLAWDKDPYLKHYGIKIENTATVTKAKLLPPPDIHFAKGGQKPLVRPGTTGFWMVDRSHLYLLPPRPLTVWHVFIHATPNGSDCVAPDRWDKFIQVFKQQYQALGHKGSIPNPTKHQFHPNNINEQIDEVMKPCANNANVIPQIILFVVPDKNSWTYDKIKKHMDCKYAVMSQVMQKAHVEKCNPKYCSNVILKVNAKLGGTTSMVTKANAKEPNFFNPSGKPVPKTLGQASQNLVMVIGADVSHPAPGSEQPSFAAVTMSVDAAACRYAAACEVNGFNKEIIQRHVWDTKVKAMVNWWVSTVGTVKGQKKAPTHLYYIRDGVSEGQYLQVLEQEVKWLREMLVTQFSPDFAKTKFTVMIASKRHHIRFLPRQEDQCKDATGNPLPGVLVERDITHPFQHDFYLNAHKAIKGTARPVHYHVIQDEAEHKPSVLHEMIYSHSYQYMRSTTPVSIHPAVYYAHLASNRARSHENAPIADAPRGGQKGIEARGLEKLETDLRINREGPRSLGPQRTSTKISSEALVLIPNETIGQFWRTQDGPARFKTQTQSFLYGMWYI